MRIRLVDAEVGDRFIGGTGIEWTVLTNDGTNVTVVSSGRQPYTNQPPSDYVVEVTNRDDSLTTEQAITNLVQGNVTGRIIE